LPKELKLSLGVLIHCGGKGGETINDNKQGILNKGPTQHPQQQHHRKKTLAVLPSLGGSAVHKIRAIGFPKRGKEHTQKIICKNY
jgi:hypothetical protein